MRRALLAALLLGTGCSADHPAVCGDATAEASEECDGNDLRGLTCAGFGFNAGSIACRRDCVLDLGACATVELCGNGLDDDADGDKDCDDADCHDDPACGACGDGEISGGETCDDGNGAAGDCCDACRAEPGCEVEPGPTVIPLTDGSGSRRGNIAPAGDVDMFLVEVPAGSTGTLVAETSAFDDGDSCSPGTDSRVEILDPSGRVVAADDDAGEGTCSRARAAGLAPGSARVRVAASPFAAGTVFGYRLRMSLSLQPCGDRVLDEGQECDDGNGAAGDGCSAACRLENRAEVEPDDDRDHAGGPFTVPFAVAGAVDPTGVTGFDEDWYAIDLAGPARLRVEVFVAEQVDCVDLLAAPALYDARGVLLAEAGFAGLDPTSCGRVVSGPLAAGRYAVLVEGRPSPARYRMTVTVAP